MTRMSRDLAQQVEQTILQRKLFGRERRILVSVSGGLDSMALLAVLSALAKKNRWELIVAHFNHRLRGQSSNADERLVAQTARTLGWKFVADRADVKQFGRKEGISLEMAARQLRHKFLARVAQQFKIRIVALAHHADDQVELFFLRLLRGASSEGLAGMEWRSASPADRRLTLVRPLLDVPKEQLEKYAQAERVKFRQDATNAHVEILRNRVRHELLPLLTKEYQPALGKVILRQMELLRAESEFMDGAARKWLAVTQKKEKFVKLPIAVQRRCIYMQLLQHGIPADFDLVETLRETPNRPVMVMSKVVITRDELGKIRLNSGNEAKTAFLEGIKELNLVKGAGEATWEGVKLCWTVSSATKPLIFKIPKKITNCEYFDGAKVGSRVILRHWSAGDRFQPIGMSNAIKLQDFFTNEKVSRSDRHQRIVATTSEGKIFWVEGLRIGERFKLDKTTRQRLKWCWDRL
ncbi:MAG: tRNA(Ile)-lysidine synthase [Pedosphaera sp.]|nr:tRNA(Ile)-lysidine synthase [Pedosphaera sp.]